MYLEKQGRIENQEVDAIVNSLGEGERVKEFGAICRSLIKVAGPELRRDILALKPVIRQVYITPAYHLKAKHVLHIAPPFYKSDSDFWDLNSCYSHIFETALKEGDRSIAIPLLGTGVNGYPMREAFKLAANVCTSFARHHPVLDIYLVHDTLIYDIPSIIASNRDFSVMFREQEYSERFFTVSIGNHIVTCPYDYLMTYLNKRDERIGYFKKTDASMADDDTPDEYLKGALVEYLAYHDPIAASKIISKWKNTTKPVIPSKRNLIFAALALGMDFGETKDLLTYYHHTLDLTNPEDAFFMFCINYHLEESADFLNTYYQAVFHKPLYQ
jgi:O-acetyl-ADP-ribose deacetylase (regulator of RNase III)